MDIAQLSVPAGRVSLAGSRWGPPGAARAVFLHAGVCDRRSWTGVVEALDALGVAGPWVAYDRRGHGDTAYTAEPFSHLDDLLAVLDVVAPGEVVWLVGSSMGGALALDAAVAAPERVAGLVLIAPGVSGRGHEPTTDPGLLALWDAVEAADKAGDLAEVNRLEALIWLDGPAGGEGRVGGAARELQLAMNLVVLEGQPMEADHAAGDTGVDAWSRLAEIDVPVTVMWGDLDIEAAEVPPLVGRITGARGIELPGRAHLPYLEDPAQTAAVVGAAMDAAVV